MDTSPDGDPDPATQRTGDRHGQEHVEGHCPESHPDRAVGGAKRDDGVHQSNRDVAVTHRGDDVHTDQDDAEQRQVPVQRLGEEARPAVARPSHRGDGPEHDDRREQDERDEAGCPGQIPQGGRAVTDGGQHAGRHRVLDSGADRESSLTGQPSV